MAMKRTLGTILVLLGVVITILSAWTLAFVAPQVSSARIVTTWAQDTTCGYGFTAVDCWASNESLSLDGPAMTVTVSLTVLKTGNGALNPDDIAFTLTVKNEGPAQYDAFGNEIAQPVYAQVTFVDTITSDQGVPIPIVNVNSLDQLLVAIRDFSDNSFIVEQRQGALGTLLFGASDTAKLNIQLRPAAFDATSVDDGQTYYIRGIVGQQAFTVNVYVTVT